MAQTIGKYKPHIAAGVLAIVSSMVYHFEGERLKAYYDPPHVATLCDGHTHGVKITDKATPELCAEYRAEDIAEANAGVKRLVRRPMTEGQEEAFTDFVFNEGEGTFSRSSILRDFNAGAVKAACESLVERKVGKDGICHGYGCGWAGNEMLNGLQQRREKEFELCMEGAK